MEPEQAVRVVQDYGTRTACIMAAFVNDCCGY